MRCQEFRELVDRYLEESLDEARREGFRSHLSSCAVCRQVALQRDPTLLFAALEPQGDDEEEVERCVTAVTASIRRDRLERRLRRPRPWLAAAAAFLAGAGVVATWEATRHDAFPAAQSAGSVATPAVAAAPRDGAPPPEVQVDMPGEGVRVYQFADQVDRNTAVCYIVTPALES